MCEFALDCGGDHDKPGQHGAAARGRGEGVADAARLDALRRPQPEPKRQVRAVA